MQYFRVAPSGDPRLVVRDDVESPAYDLTSAKPKIRTYGDLLAAADVAGTSADDIATELRSEGEQLPRERLEADATRPLDASEIWAAGVTYRISEKARESESDTPDVYVDVYDSDRPEIFFKATPSRTVGPNEPVGIRADSTWDVPEPELGVVLYRGDVVGYTIGNDMSSRSIEGANPLYLPQAKVYDRCCAVGPCVVSADEIDPHDLTIALTIERERTVVYEGSTSTSEMVRTCEELASYFTKHNAVPELAVLLTGTSLVPEDDFTLQVGDDVRVAIDDIGVLENPVIEV